MYLLLDSINEVISKEVKQCDAINILFDYMNHVPVKEVERNIVVLFKVRKMKIQPNEKYLHISFIDTETGEQLEFNCKKGVHKYCVEKNIYPNYIINALK